MFLKTVQSGAQCFVDESPFKQSLADLFWPRLEWRLNCPCCGKFSSAVLSEPVVRVWAGRAAAPLAAHLQRFLSERSCPCGHVMSGLSPTRVQLPEYLMVEVDRRASAHTAERTEVWYGTLLYGTLQYGTVSYSTQMRVGIQTYRLQPVLLQ
jgi:hypothetical protein